MVKPGACVIDVGITRVYRKESDQTFLVGDVDFEGTPSTSAVICTVTEASDGINLFVISGVSEVAGFITPVPGGVGPMTVAMLLKNTIKAATQQMGILNASCR